MKMNFEEESQGAEAFERLFAFEGEPTREQLLASLQALGGLEGLEHRDREFVQKLLERCDYNPDILLQVVDVRRKLTQNLALDQEEANLLMDQLHCRGFYQSGLNVDGLTFQSLQMEDARIGGDASFAGVTVLGDNNQRSMKVKGTLCQEFMTVHGDNYQEAMDAEKIQHTGMRVFGEDDQKWVLMIARALKGFYRRLSSAPSKFFQSL